MIMGSHDLSTSHKLLAQFKKRLEVKREREEDEKTQENTSNYLQAPIKIIDTVFVLYCNSSDHKHLAVSEKYRGPVY